MKKGIMGGTFDPIHNGHLYICEKAMELLGLDEIIFVPAGNPPHKTDKSITEASVRYDLIKGAIKDKNRFSISDFEVKKEDYSYSYKTIKYFLQLEPDTQWYFITGADCLMNLHTWKKVPEILSMCSLVVLSREGYNREEEIKKKQEIEKDYNATGKIILIEVPFVDISSTQIRNMIRQGENIEKLVPSYVNKEIIKQNLYK